MWSGFEKQNKPLFCQSPACDIYRGNICTEVKICTEKAAQPECRLFQVTVWHFYLKLDFPDLAFLSVEGKTDSLKDKVDLMFMEELSK